MTRRVPERSHLPAQTTASTATTAKMPFISISSVYLDEVMPWLTDTEWRVLCVVIRQTLGWNKERDWITRSQIAYKTGRSQDAVTRAVEGLVRADLIVVEDGKGEMLLSPLERRRRSRDRLHYRLLSVTSVTVLDLIQQRSGSDVRINRNHMEWG